MKKAQFQITLAGARTSNGLTIEEVANKLHVSKATIVTWENDSSKIKFKNLMELSNLYGVPMDYIYCGNKYDFISSQKGLSFS